ncbi:MAG: tetratricopeptide repeat protein [Planctomycetaceae bacterium]
MSTAVDILRAPGSRRNRLRRFGFPLLLLAVTVTVFGRILEFEFVAWDDDYHILENPWFRQLSWAQVRHFWTEPYFGLYIPVSYTFFALETLVGRVIIGDETGFSPEVFHAGSLILHLLSTLVIYFLLKRLIADATAAFAGSLIFCVHPLQVESVAWISETRGLLSAFLSLLSVSCYLRAANSPIPAQVAESGVDPHRISRLWYLSATFAFLLALLAKPTAVSVPVIIVIVDQLLVRQSLRLTLMAMLPWLVIACGVVVLNKSLQSDESINVIAPWWQRPFIAADAIAFYFRKALLPLGLNFDYGRSPARAVQASFFWTMPLVPVSVLAAVAFIRPLRRYLPAIGVFLAALLPGLGIIPFAHQEISTVADRYCYLALSGLALGVASFVSQTQTVARAGGIVIWAFLLAGGAIAQSDHWRNSQNLFEHSLKLNPQSFVSCNNYGNVLLQSGNIERAIHLYRQALAVKPDYARAHYGIGIALIQAGHNEEAEGHLQESIRIDPSSARAHYDLAVLVSQRGHDEQAIVLYREAIKREPTHAGAHNNLGLLLAERGDMPLAEQHFLAAVSADSKSTDARVNLANLLILHGDAQAAVSHYLAALKVQPELPNVHANLGRYFLQQGHLEQAAQHLQSARRLSPENSDVHFDLGVVYDRQGRTGLAVSSYEAALKLHPTHPKAHLNMAILLHRRKQTEAAVQHLSDALNSDPTLAAAHNMLGIIHSSREHWNDAVLHFDAAIRIDPQFAAAYYHLAHVHYRQGRKDAAIDNLRHALQLVPSGSVAATDIQDALRKYLK